MDATTEKAISVTMTGGAPWGFRLTGGEGTPLQVSKIRKRSKANTAGLEEADIVLQINGENVEGKTHTSAMEMVDAAQKDLELEIVRGRRPLPPLPSDNVAVSQSPAAPLTTSEQVVLEESTTVNMVISHEESEPAEHILKLEESEPAEHILTIETPETKTIDIKVEKEQTGVTSSEVTSSSMSLPNGGNVDVVVEKKTIVTSSVADTEGADVSIQKTTIITTTSTTSSTTSSVKESTVSHKQVGAMELTPAPVVNHVPTSMVVNHSITQMSSTMQPNEAPPTRGTKMIDEALSKLDSFPKVSELQYTALEDTNAQFMQDQFPTETVTAELKENYKENIVPIQNQSYQDVQVNKSPISFHVKKFSSSSSTSSGGNKMYQPSICAWPSETVDRLPSIIDIQRQKFQQEQQRQQQKMKRPAPPPQQLYSPLSENTANQQWMPPQQQWQPNQQWAPSRPPPPTHPKPTPVTVDHSDHKRMHVFGPPVIISLDSQKAPSSDDDSSIIRQGKKLYSDSAFYNDPNEKYPTIEEQMKLCQTIAQSLTAVANKKARGARMFAKRKNRATRWIHDGYERSFSSDGDVANTDDLESELWAEEGGNKPLFHFRIPNVARQVSSPDGIQKMALSKNEFEKLRFEKQKCEHKGVSPVTCFNLVADLQSHKGRGAKIFERRKQTSENWVVDETNVKSPPIRSPTSVPPSKLSEMLQQPPRAQMSPWEAAMGSPHGAVDAAFDHLSDYEKMKRRNQAMSMQPVPPMAPMPHGKHTSLAADHHAKLLQGQNFNRMAKGWGMYPDDSLSGFTQSPVSSGRASPSFRQEPPPVQPKPKAKQQFRDFNPRPKAWAGAEDMSVGSTHSLQRETHINNYQADTSPQQYGSLPTQFRQHHGGGYIGQATPSQGYRQSNQQNRSSFHQNNSSQQQFQQHRQQQPLAMPGTDL